MQTLVAAAPAVHDGPGLIAPAMPLLQLLARLRTMATQPDAADLRARTEAELRAFEVRAEGAGVSPDQVRRAHYALCVSLDDLVLNTPWGARGAWAGRPLVAIFHPTIAPERFFGMLRQMQEKAGTFRPVLELMFVCVSLGMLGQFRDRPAEAEALRQAAAVTLARQAPPPAELAPRWQGIEAPFLRRRTRFPVWVAASLGLAVVGGGYLWLTLRVNDRSDAVFAGMLAAQPSHMPALARSTAAIPVPAPPPSPEPTAQDRLRARLPASGPVTLAVTLAGTPTDAALRIPAAVLFRGGTATLAPAAAPVLQAIADAIRPETGRIDVIGYTDDRPVHAVAYPSAVKLSAAQADAVRRALGRLLGAAAPIAAEGRAEADPVADNATPEGRAQNRRVEIVLGPAAP